jgi:uncharacterized protein involved in outer membrane biogenesis
MKKLKKIILALVVLVVVVLIAVVAIAALYLGDIVKKGIETVAPPITKTSVTVDSVGLSILSGGASINGFVIGNPDPADYTSTNAISLGKAAVSLEPKSLLSDKIIIHSIEVRSPQITFEGNPFGKNNLQSILDNVHAPTGGGTTAKSTTAAAKTPGASRKLEVDNFVFSNAVVTARITGIGSQPLVVTLPIPDIQFSNLGTGPDGITAADLTQKLLEQVIDGSLSAVVAKAREIATGVANDAIKGATGAVNSAATNAVGQGVDSLKKGLGNLLK